MTRPELHIAVAGTKNTATNYNENFEMMMQYCEDEAGASKDYVDNALIPYLTVNTLNTSGTITLTDNSMNKITPTGNVTFTLPVVNDNSTYHQILVQVYITGSYTIGLGTSNYFDLQEPILTANGLYNLYYEYDNIGGVWVCGYSYKGNV